MLENYDDLVTLIESINCKERPSLLPYVEITKNSESSDTDSQYKVEVQTHNNDLTDYSDKNAARKRVFLITYAELILFTKNFNLLSSCELNLTRLKDPFPKIYDNLPEDDEYILKKILLRNNTDNPEYLIPRFIYNTT